jgi:hypothetical protein
MTPNHVRTVLETSRRKNVDIYGLSATNVAEMLRGLITEMGHQPDLMSVETMTDIANRLSEVAQQEPAWGWRYVRNVLNHKIEASAKMSAAIMKLGALVDGVPQQQVDIFKVQALSIHSLHNGVMILADERQCSYVACGLWFIPRAWNQAYHSHECRTAARKQKKGEL